MAIDSEHLEEELFEAIQSGSSSINSKKAAIRVAKDRGWVKQKGDKLVITKKGEDAARSANQPGSSRKH